VTGEVVAFARETVIGWESLDIGDRVARGRAESLFSGPRSVVVRRIRYIGGDRSAR
jgi:hypothetical protein